VIADQNILALQQGLGSAAPSAFLTIGNTVSGVEKSLEEFRRIESTTDLGRDR